VKYCICKERGTRVLVSQVNKLLRKGWRPLGGVAVVAGESYLMTEDWWFCQAMVHDGEEASKK
jgi:hypothetical protein